MKKNTQDAIIAISIMSILFVIFFIGINHNKKEKQLLREHGKNCKALVLEKYRRAKGLRVLYKFNANGLIIENECRITHNDNINVGDSIDIVYLENNPKKNKLKRDLEK